MGILRFFSGKTPEEHEKRADAYFDKEAYGDAKIEYEKAIDKLGKKTQMDPDLKKRLDRKLVQSREALAFQHKQTGEELIETGNYEDAEEILRLALELTEDKRLTSEIEEKLQEVLSHYSELEIKEFLRLDSPGENRKQPNHREETEEYFAVLCSTLPELERKAYRSYGNAFKKGYVALNKGDFKLAVTQLSIALEQSSSSASFIPLELATAYLNLGNYEKARSLLEGFLKDHPESTRAYQLLCEIFWETGEFDRAEEVLLSCPQELIDSVIISLLRGETLFQAKRYEDAESFYLDYLQSYGWDESVVRSLAKTYEALGLKENARDLYGEIIGRCQSCRSWIDPYIKRRYADTSFETGQFSTEILELYLALAEEDPYNRAYYYQKVSQIYTSLGNEREARRFLSFAKKL
jgi:tetratricopeptide (TPR) repeat protein